MVVKIRRFVERPFVGLRSKCPEYFLNRAVSETFIVFGCPTLATLKNLLL